MTDCEKRPLVKFDKVSLVYAPLRTDRSIFRPSTLRGKRLRIEALSGVSFRLYDGERFGIVGANGAGKTTLLRVAAGFFAPTAGDVETNAQTTSLIDSGFGLAPTLSGRQNAKTFAVIRGLRGSTIEEYLKLVEHECGLGTAFDNPISAYSTGMTTRLVFALCTAMPPRLLILDELLSAGDASFQDRAAKKFREFMNIATGVLLATHNMSLVNELCDRCMWLDHGTIREIGDAREVTKKYLASSHSA